MASPPRAWAKGGWAGLIPHSTIHSIPVSPLSISNFSPYPNPRKLSLLLKSKNKSSHPLAVFFLPVSFSPSLPPLVSPSVYMGEHRVATVFVHTRTPICVPWLRAQLRFQSIDLFMCIFPFHLCPSLKAMTRKQPLKEVK